MARQLFQDGPYVDTILSSPAANTNNTITAIWSAAQFTPIYANDPKAGKIYCVRAGGILTSGTAGSTLVVTPRYGTGGSVLGASTAQAMPAATNVVWRMDADLVWRVIGAPGANSSAVLIGCFYTQGTIATNGTGTNIPFGATLIVNLDASTLSNVEICTTWSAGSNSVQTHYAYIFSRN